MSHFWEFMLTIIAASAGVAIVAVLVSKNAQTAGVIQSFSSGWGNILSTAISPVTGATTAANLSYPGSGVMGSLAVQGNSVY